MNVILGTTGPNSLKGRNWIFLRFLKKKVISKFLIIYKKKDEMILPYVQVALEEGEVVNLERQFCKVHIF